MLYLRKALSQREIDQHAEWVKKHAEAGKKALERLKATKELAEEEFWKKEAQKFQRQHRPAKFVPGVGAKREVKKYTGSEIIGIAAMHKSNEVPIFNTDAAKDVAKMRR